MSIISHARGSGRDGWVYWSPIPRLWPSSCENVSWILRLPVVPHAFRIEMTP